MSQCLEGIIMGFTRLMLNLFSVSKLRLKGNLILLHKYRHRKTSDIWGLNLADKGVRISRVSKQKVAKFKLERRHKFLTIRRINHRNSLPREVVNSSLVEVFNSRLDVFLKDMLKYNNELWCLIAFSCEAGKNNSLQWKKG